MSKKYSLEAEDKRTGDEFQALLSIFVLESQRDSVTAPQSQRVCGRIAGELAELKIEAKFMRT